MNCFIDLSDGEKHKAVGRIALLFKEFPNDAGLLFCKAVLHRLDGEYFEALEVGTDSSGLIHRTRSSRRGIVPEYIRFRVKMKEH